MTELWVNFVACALLLAAAGVLHLVSDVAIKRYAKKVVKDYAERFPGQCFVCGLHRYGLYAGTAEELWPEPHECIERMTR